MRVAVAYVVTAWLLLQVADIVLPAFDAPAWSLRVMIILLTAGFPIALAVSWLFDLTSKGLVRTDDLPAGASPESTMGPLLNYVIIGVLAAAVLLFALDRFVWRTNLNASAPGSRVLAVLPFENMGPDQASEAFAAGIHDDLLTQLSKIHAFRTVSRTSVLRFAHTQQPIPEIAAALGASVVLEGGVQRSADRIRINAQLIDGTTDTHLWAETYDRQLSARNLFAIQSEIARAIAAALKATLSPEEQQRLDRIPTRNLEAYDAYTAGRSRLDGANAEELETAVSQFNRAVALDPEFAAAWAGLCKAELSRYKLDSDRSHFDAAEAACKKALELDNSSVAVYIALGTLYRYFGQYARAEVALQRAHYAKAEQALEQALSMDSQTVEAKVELSKVLAREDRLDEAENELLEAEVLAPADWNVEASLFSFYYVYSNRADRFQMAARHAAKAASLRPDLAASWNNLGTAHFMLDQYDEAAQAWQQSLDLEPTRTAYTNTGLALYYAGDYAKAAEMQRKATELAPDDHRAWGRLADALRFIDGERDQAAANYARAAQLARAVLEVNAKDWRTRGMLGFYLVHSGDPEGAEQAANQAIADSDRRSEALLYGALVQQALGQDAVALDLLEEAVKRDAEYRHLIANDPDLRRLAPHERFAALVRQPAR